MASIVIILAIGGKVNLLLGWFFRNWGTFEFFVYFDVFTDFFFGFFINLAHTFGFTSGIGNGNQAHGNDCGPTDSYD
jgi:hypothetical protein